MKKTSWDVAVRMMRGVDSKGEVHMWMWLEGIIVSYCIGHWHIFSDFKTKLPKIIITG